MHLGRVAVVASLVTCSLCAGGCLIVKGNSTEEAGVKVTSNTLDQVKLGETTDTWLVAALGEPSSSRNVDEHTRILRYDHTITTQKGGAVFLLFAGGESAERTSSVIFEVTDGIVTRYWTEGT